MNWLASNNDETRITIVKPNGEMINIVGIPDDIDDVIRETGFSFLRGWYYESKEVAMRYARLNNESIAKESVNR